jgi:hypothetical protein
VLPAKPAPAPPPQFAPPGSQEPGGEEDEGAPANARDAAERAVRVALRSTAEKKSLEDWVVSMILNDEP